MPLNTVSTVTKVRVGRHTYQFELSEGKLVIEYSHGRKPTTHITLGALPLDTLRELLAGIPLVKLAVRLPEEPIETTPEGLTRHGDGIEAGMAE